ncbi:hypothetical protein [Salibacterium aidingense]|uniref:hypothetical protein n=1 Tax=Salibacterium aidingense TaxID=384933 RepID=UPI000408B14F|nr:hypothetical protein [Salibacterium aidingense]
MIGIASVLERIACPNCSCVALEDFYYKIGETYILCNRCGYQYARELKLGPDRKERFEENEIIGFGCSQIVNKDGSTEREIFREPISSDTIQQFRYEWNKGTTNQEKSFLLSFENGIFTPLIGTPPKDFLKPYDEIEDPQRESIIIGSDGTISLE